uniref:CAP-Gly domain-containing protein n=1 Tax=Panagrolaimus sp. JU765 TaxID=591449 RepID=A0AC34PU80_9BILA
MALNLTIKSANDFNYQKHFPETLTLVEFKQKLELITGILSSQMKLALHDADNKFVKELKIDEFTLKQLGVVNDSIINVSDISGVPQTFGAQEDVPRFVISEEKYNQREDSAKKWKESILSSGYKPKELIGPHIAVGNRVVVKFPGQPDKRGKIEFVGETQFKPGSTWVGVCYDEPVGKNDGSMEGHRYFTCQPNHGAFVRPANAFPEPVDPYADEF